MAAKKILMLVGDYVEDYEVMCRSRRCRWSDIPFTQSARARRKVM